jgi:argininosuccinate lyase
MKNPFIVFIESNTSGTGRLFVKAARECGYRPVMLVEKPERYSFLEQDSVSYMTCNTSSNAEIEDALQSLGREAPLSGIFSSSEYFVETAAAFAAKYGLPGENPSALGACRNKWVQRQHLQCAGLLTPRFECINSVQQAMAALKNISLPVIVKPVMGSGSVGVRLCYNADDVTEHVSDLLRRTANERGLPVSSDLLIEEYLVGPEYSVETLGEVVLGITRKHVSPEPFFVELGHDFPTDLSPEVAEEIAGVARCGLRSVGLCWGPAHVEMRLTDNGPAIVEINPRLAGGFIPEIMRLAFGVDIIREIVKQVVGDPAQIQPNHAGHASIRFLVPSRNGVITSIQGVEEASKIDGVVDIQTYRAIGDRVGIENDFRDRIGHVISCADLEITAASVSEAARRKISIAVSAQ